MISGIESARKCYAHACELPRVREVESTLDLLVDTCVLSMLPGKLESVQALMDAGASTDVTDAKGRTPLQAAQVFM